MDFLLTSFSSAIKPLVSEEKDKYLALASLKDLEKFIPNIDVAKDFDLLPIAFNACVINRPNKNDDIMDTATAVAVYKHFINKPINIEHNRQKVIGVIMTAGFSEFGTDKPLTEEEVKTFKGPFNIVLGGVVWKSVNPKLATLIEESSDPNSEDYLRVSASWELGFYKYNIVLMDENKKNLEQGQIITTDASDYEKLKPYLKASKGGGKFGEKRVYRMPFLTEGAAVIPMGVGLTENPAAEVKGIAVKKEEEAQAKFTEEEIQKEMAFLKECYQEFRDGKITKEQLKEKTGSEFLVVEERIHAVASADDHYIEKCSCGTQLGSCRCSSPNKKIITIEAGCEKCKESANKFSQSQKLNVNIERQPIMKITSLKDITDETLKQATAAAISEFISDHLKEKAQEWNSEKDKLNKQLQDATASADNFKKEVEKLTKEFETVKTALATLETEKKEREKVEKFNERMTKVNESFDLTDEARAAVAEELRAIASDEDFDKWNKKASVLLKGFAKKKETAEEKKAREEKEAGSKKQEAKAAFEKAFASATTKEEKERIVAEALDNAVIDKSEVPNTAIASEPSLKDKFKTAFAAENFVINVR